MLKTKRFLPILLIFFVLSALAPTAVFADDPVSGKCGDNVSWSYNATQKQLIINGTGDMDDYSFYFDVPWYKYSSKIVSVQIKGAVTSIGE